MMTWLWRSENYTGSICGRTAAARRTVPVLSPMTLLLTSQFPQGCPHLCRTLSPFIHVADFVNNTVRRTSFTAGRANGPWSGEVLEFGTGYLSIL